MYLAIYSKDTRRMLDIIRTYNYVQYINEYCWRGSFTITVPIQEESLQYLVFGNYIYFELGVWGVIKQVQDTETSEFEVSISGYLMNHLLEYRSFLLTTKYYENPSKIARAIVNDLFINPTDSRRKISPISLSSYSWYQGNGIISKISFQNTGNTALEVLEKLLSPYDMGFELYTQAHMMGNEEALLDVMEFRIITPVDRTIDNTEGNDPVVFSFDLNNISQIEYEDDGRDYRSVAVVASEGRGEDRKVIEVGDTEATGIDRIELYVDARDLQSDEEDDLSEEVEQLESDVSGLKTDVSNVSSSVNTVSGNLNGYSFGYTDDGKPAYKAPNSNEYVAFKSGGGGEIEIIDEYTRNYIPKDYSYSAITTFTSITVANGYAIQSVTRG